MGHSLCAVLGVAFVGECVLHLDYMSAPSPLLGLQWSWYLWFSSPPPRAEVSLGRSPRPLRGQLARCQTCSAALDRLLLRLCWRAQVHRVGEHMVLVTPVLLCRGRAPGAALQNSCEAWLDPQDSVGEGHTVNKRGGECSCWFYRCPGM